VLQHAAGTQLLLVTTTPNRQSKSLLSPSCCRVVVAALLVAPRFSRRRRTIAAGLLLVVCAAVSGCGGLYRQFEYEEEMYVSLDGTATILVNSSVRALNALRGTSFDARPNARLDRTALREYYTTPATRVTRVSSSRRNNRLFAHVRIDVDDVRRLGDVQPFSWSSYEFSNDGDLVVYRQSVGAAAGEALDAGGWNGGEQVAFRLHLPSEVVYHNSQSSVQRGNILEWEQPLTDRLNGLPVTIEVQIKPQSILYRTLLLFGGTVLAVGVMFSLLIAWIAKRGPGTPRV
jgi:hypothetical protein